MSVAATPLNVQSLLPQDQLARLMMHEYRELGRYRQLALAFLPNREDISLVMALFGIECEQRLGALNRVCERMPTPDSEWSHLRRRLSGALDSFRHQPFVECDEGAKRVMTQALLDTKAAMGFYEEQLRYCCALELRQTLEGFARQNRVAQRIQEEFLV
jgi:hypothetical protein